VSRPTTVLVVGATGSIGRLVVEEALRQGYRTRALVRDAGQARGLPTEAEVVVGDLTRADTLTASSARVAGRTRSCGRAGSTTTPPTSTAFSCCRAIPGRPGDASDGAIARRQIAQVLVASLSSAAAARKTFELVAEHGPAPTDLDPLFAALEPDAHGVLDGVHDMANMALSEEPARVQDDLKALGTWRNRP
jgi:uncharacterized protein YbjT (DUF2867 family)